MSSNHSEDVSKHIKLYLAIGAALFVGTIITVWAASFRLPIVVGIAVAVAIASVKGSLVSGFFMHLRDERKLIYGVLALTAAFIVVMVGLLLFAFGDQQGIHQGAFIVPDGHAKVHHHEEAQMEGEHVP